MELGLKVQRQGSLFTEAAPKVIQEGLDRFVTLATQLLLVEVKKRTPQGVFGAQGGLLGSIQSTPIVGKGTPLVKGEVVSAHSYAEVVEKGRQPGKGMPPMGSLVRWIEVKMGLPESEAKRIEFVVRRSIGRKGFAGAQMFERALIDNLNRLQAMGEAQGLQIAAELNQ
jgi:hypothetical protein